MKALMVDRPAILGRRRGGNTCASMTNNNRSPEKVVFGWALKAGSNPARSF